MPTISLNQSNPSAQLSTPATSLRSALSRLGFIAGTDDTWESLVSNPPDVVFIAPARDTIPSSAGNAIYVLVERLCAGLPFSCAILARYPMSGSPKPCGLSHRILYYRNPMRPTFLERRLPCRVKVFIWGHELLHQLAYAKAAGDAARHLRSKLIIVEDTPAFCPPVRTAVGRGSRVVLHQHCNKPCVLYAQTWRRISRALDRIVFVSEKTRRDTELEHGRLKVSSHVIHCGVDLEHFAPGKWHTRAASIRSDLGIPEDSKVLLFVGRLVPDKGVAEAAEAFNLANLPGAHMIVVGNLDIVFCRNEAYLNRLRAAAKVSSGCIHIVGVVPQEGLPSYYEASDITIVPSIGSEGLPKTIIETLAMGRPVIASDRGGTWELLNQRRNAWLLRDPSSPTAIAEVIRTAFNSTSTLKRMSAEILATDRPHLSEQKMVDEFAKVLAPFLSR